MSQESMCKIDTSGSQQGTKATKTVSSANGIWETVYLNLPVSSHLVGCVPLHGTYKSSLFFYFSSSFQTHLTPVLEPFLSSPFHPTHSPTSATPSSGTVIGRVRDLTTCEIHRPTISGPRHMNSINAAEQSREHGRKMVRAQ